MHKIMRKILTQQFVGFLGILCSIILSITLYAYKSDQTSIEERITVETINRENADVALRYGYEQSMRDHEKIHVETNRQYEQIQNDLNIIKKHLINRK